MRKILLAALLCLAGALAGAQTPAPVHVTYSPNNPAVFSCNKGASWFNTTTNHWWLCDISTTPAQFVDTSGGGGGTPTFIRSESGANSAEMRTTTTSFSQLLTLPGLSVGRSTTATFDTYTMTQGAKSIIQAITYSGPTFDLSLTEADRLAQFFLDATNGNVTALLSVSTDLGGQSQISAVPGQISHQVTLGSLTSRIRIDPDIVNISSNLGGGQVTTLNVNAARGVGIETQGAKPTCDISNRFRIWSTAGAEAVADAFEVCMKDATDTYDWVPLATP